MPAPADLYARGFQGRVGRVKYGRGVYFRLKRLELKG